MTSGLAHIQKHDICGVVLASDGPIGARFCALYRLFYLQNVCGVSLQVAWRGDHPTVVDAAGACMASYLIALND